MRQRKYPKAGRPVIPVGDPELHRVEQLAGFGLTEAQIAHALDMDPRTFRRNKVASERIMSALARGKAKAEGIIGQALFVKAKGGDVQAIRWWEMTRAGRKEASKTELTGKDGSPLIRQSITFGGRTIDF